MTAGHAGSVIRNTFQILPSVGNGKERNLWKNGVRDWDEFRSEKKVRGISAERKESMDRHLDQADEFLDRGMTDYFSRILPTVEHWRLYDRFRRDTAFLDIETDGRSSYANVTVVGIHRSDGTVALVRGQDLSAESLAEALDGAVREELAQAVGVVPIGLGHGATSTCPSGREEFRISRRRMRPRRTWVLTVPRGRPVASAMRSWLRPW